MDENAVSSYLNAFGGIDNGCILSNMNQMTTEQRQQISEWTMIASEANDIDTLIKLRKIIIKDIRASEFKTREGAEWFESLLTGEQIEAVYASSK